MRIPFSEKLLRIDGVLYDLRLYPCPSCGARHPISEAGIERAKEIGKLTLFCSGETVSLDDQYCPKSLDIRVGALTKALPNK